VVEARAEDAGKDTALRGTFALVTSRAMASPGMALELASPFLRPGGIAVLWLGPGQESAIYAKSDIPEIGLTMTREHKYILPDEIGRRWLALYRKTGTIRPGYPRKIPSIRARPLL
jgi:16S rRNA G527 N7-methylase RsmG